MGSIFEHKENTKEIFDKISANPEYCKELIDTFYEQVDDMDIIDDVSPDMFSKAIFSAYENRDLTAFLMAVCGCSMFDLLRNAYLIPMEFGGDKGRNPVLLTDKNGMLSEKYRAKVSDRMYQHFKKIYNEYINNNQCTVYLADGYQIKHRYNEDMSIDIAKSKETTGILLLLLLLLYDMPDTKEHNITEVQAYNMIWHEFRDIQNEVPTSFVFYGQDTGKKDEKRYDELGVLLPLHKFEMHLKYHMRRIDYIVAGCREKIMKELENSNG